MLRNAAISLTRMLLLVYASHVVKVARNVLVQQLAILAMSGHFIKILRHKHVKNVPLVAKHAPIQIHATVALISKPKA